MSKPPKPPSSFLQDTPWNKGSGSHSQFNTQNTQQEYKPYLEEDLKNSKVTISFEQFLTHILRVSPEWRNREKTRIDKIAKSEEYNKKLQAYAKRVTHETDRYHPFVKLANYVVKQLQREEELDICFCRNDPIIIRGSCAHRKPDVCTANKGVVNEGERGGIDNLSKGGPAGSPFCWADLISFWEFKRVVSDLEYLTDIADPSSSSPSGAVGSLPNNAMSQSPAASTSTLPSTAPNVNLRTITPRHHRSEATSRRTTRSKSQANKSQSSAASTSAQQSSEATTPLPSGPTTRSKTQANALSGELSNKRSTPDHDSDISSRKRAKTNFDQSRTKGETQDPLSLQCASYALELLSHGGLRSHVIAGSVEDQCIKLLYYDHSIIIESTPIDFMTNHSIFIALLSGLATLTPEQWGYHSIVDPPCRVRPPPLEQDAIVSLRTLEGQEIKLEGGKSLQLGKTVYHQHGLIGRGTWVLRAKLRETGSDGGSDAIVKLSWSPTSRKSEHAMINQARGNAILYGDQWVLDHLPNVLHSQDFDETKDGPVKGLIELLGDKYEPRVLRLLVLEELFPITELAAASDLANAFRDIFKCYEWLYTKSEIFHRDISLNNMMYRKKDGKIFGVLNDYDLAIFKSNTTPSSKTRTGTKPFMAIDLLGQNPDAHRYRHDLESMYYVIVFVTTRYHDSKEIADPPLQEWVDLGENYLKSTKVMFITETPPPATPSYVTFDAWTERMRDALIQGRISHTRHLGEVRRTERVGNTPPVFDVETLNGHFSFETFRAILDYPVA